MSDLQKKQEKLKRLMEKLTEIRKKTTLTDKDRQVRERLLKEAKALADDIESHNQLSDLEARENGSDTPPAGVGGAPDDVISRGRGTGLGYELRSHRQRKTYRDLYGQQPINDFQWRDQDMDFFSAVLGGRYHPDLHKRSMTEGISSDGGFLVPSETSSMIHNVSLENEIVMPRCFVQPMKSLTCSIPGVAIGDHSSNLYGGFKASYEGEATKLTDKNPKLRDVNLAAKKFTGFIRMSNEVYQDSGNGANKMIQLSGDGISWNRDKAFLKGSGSGEPLGVLNSPCLISVEPEAGQAAGTIVYKNILKMLSRLWSGSFNNSVWLAHPTVLPDLMSLIVTSGSHVPVLKERDGSFSLLGRPLIFTEKVESQGIQGDIVLADFSQYVVGLREEMRFDVSEHIFFDSDEIAARIIERHDGTPIWNEPLTLADGATQVSPFVTLAARE